MSLTKSSAVVHNNADEPRAYLNELTPVILFIVSHAPRRLYRFRSHDYAGSV